jgi:hypothetical protein
MGSIAKSLESKQQPSALTAPSVKIMLHIAYRGDVWFHSDEWGDAAAPEQWIEGLVVKLGDGINPSEVECQAVGADGTPSEVVAGGEFCGSRGKRKPLHGLTMRTSKYSARHWNFEYFGRFADDTQVGPIREGGVCRAASGAALTGVNVRIDRPEALEIANDIASADVANAVPLATSSLAAGETQPADEPPLGSRFG